MDASTSFLATRFTASESFQITYKALRNAVLHLDRGKGTTFKKLSRYFRKTTAVGRSKEEVYLQLKKAYHKGVARERFTRTSFVPLEDQIIRLNTKQPGDTDTSDTDDDLDKPGCSSKKGKKSKKRRRQKVKRIPGKVKVGRKYFSCIQEELLDVLKTRLKQDRRQRNMKNKRADFTIDYAKGESVIPHDD